jgi:hypothetical protein
MVVGVSLVGACPPTLRTTPIDPADTAAEDEVAVGDRA